MWIIGGVKSFQQLYAVLVALTMAFGTGRNGNTRGPGFLNVDMSAFKDFHTFREQTIGFRFDAFNAFNIASYGNPDIGITDNNFGNISDQGAVMAAQCVPWNGICSFPPDTASNPENPSHLQTAGVIACNRSGCSFLFVALRRLEG